MKRQRIIEATRVLEEYEVRYVLFMRQDSLDDFRDIDVIICRKDLARSVRALVHYFSNTGMKLFKFIRNSYIWQLYFYDDATAEVLQIDLMPEVSFRGVPYLDADTIFRSAETHEGVFYVNERLHLAANIYRDYVQLGAVSQKVHARLLEVGDGQEVPGVFQDVLGQKFDNILTSSPTSKVGIFSKLLCARFWSSPLDTAKGLFRHFCLSLGRNIWYPGIFVAFLGADGARKAGAIEAVMEEFDLMDAELLYLMPGFLSSQRSSTVEGTGPQEFDHPPRDKRGLLFSLVQQLVWITEYIGCYFYLLLRPLYLGKLVISDRYYSDILVHKNRYRYGGPDWYLRFCYHFIPKPDLTIVIHNPPEISQSRGPEVRFEKSRERSDADAVLSSKIRNIYLIDAGNPLDTVAKDIISLILFALRKKAAERLENIK